MHLLKMQPLKAVFTEQPEIWRILMGRPTKSVKPRSRPFWRPFKRATFPRRRLPASLFCVRQISTTRTSQMGTSQNYETLLVFACGWQNLTTLNIKTGKLRVITTRSELNKTTVFILHIKHRRASSFHALSLRDGERSFRVERHCVSFLDLTVPLALERRIKTSWERSVALRDNCHPGLSLCGPKQTVSPSIDFSGGEKINPYVQPCGTKEGSRARAGHFRMPFGLHNSLK